MSERDKTPVLREPTIFENIWQNDPDDLCLFRSEADGVMSIADRFPKLPLQIVIAANEGKKGAKVHFADLPRPKKRALHEVADAMEEKMLPYLNENQRVITHVEGFGVPDHAHIVMFAAERGEGQRLYTKELLGIEAVRRTVECMRLTQDESASLYERLHGLHAPATDHQ